MCDIDKNTDFIFGDVQTGMLGNMTIVAILYIGTQQVRNGVISLGDLTSFLMWVPWPNGDCYFKC